MQGRRSPCSSAPAEVCDLDARVGLMMSAAGPIMKMRPSSITCQCRRSPARRGRSARRRAPSVRGRAGARWFRRSGPGSPAKARATVRRGAAASGRLEHHRSLENLLLPRRLRFPARHAGKPGAATAERARGRARSPARPRRRAARTLPPSSRFSRTRHQWKVVQRPCGTKPMPRRSRWRGDRCSMAVPSKRRWPPKWRAML